LVLLEVVVDPAVTVVLVETRQLLEVRPSCYKEAAARVARKEVLQLGLAVLQLEQNA
jgi:hypothetical protein